MFRLVVLEKAKTDRLVRIFELVGIRRIGSVLGMVSQLLRRAEDVCRKRKAEDDQRIKEEVDKRVRESFAKVNMGSRLLEHYRDWAPCRAECEQSLLDNLVAEGFLAEDEVEDGEYLYILTRKGQERVDGI